MKWKTGQKKNIQNKACGEVKQHGEYSEKVYHMFDQSPRMGEERE